MAVIIRTGADPFGEFVHRALVGYGVDDRYVTPVAALPAPVTFCEIFPPDNFPLYFYRVPKVAVGSREPAEIAGALLALGAELAIVKLGPDGVLAVDRCAAVRVPPVTIDVVNGIGAGDAFGGALCHGLLAGWELAQTIRFANAAGAIVASRIACSDAMPTAGEVDAPLVGAPLAEVPRAAAGAKEDAHA